MFGWLQGSDQVQQRPQLAHHIRGLSARDNIIHTNPVNWAMLLYFNDYQARKQAAHAQAYLVFGL